MSKAHGPLADRPINPKVGLEIPHESADLHVTGEALYTDDLVGRVKDRAARLAGADDAARTARSPGSTLHPAYEVPGVVRVLTAEDVPGVNDSGIKHDEPLFPSEVMFYGHAVCWVLGGDAGRRAVRRGGRRRRGRAAAVAADADGSHCGGELPGAPAHREPRRRGRGIRWSGAPVLRGVRVRRAGALLPGDQRRAGHGRRVRPDLHPVQHPAPLRNPRDHRPRPRIAEFARHRAVPADGRRLRRQGDAAARVRGGRRAGRGGHRPAGAAAAEPDPRHDHDRQATPVPRHLGGRVRRGPPDLCAPRHADQRRRVEPRPVRAGPRPGAVSHRQRLLGAEHRGARQDRQDQQDVSDGVPRLRWPAGHDRHGGPARSLRAAARRRTGGSTAPQPVCARPDHSVRATGPARGTTRGDLVDRPRARRVRPAACRDRRLQQGASGHQARHRHHAREVRHLFQPHRFQPGRRAGARLQGRLRADQPRRHGDGPGPAHEDDPGGGDRAGCAARARAAGARPGPTRCPTPRRPPPVPARTSTAARSRTRATRSASGWPWSRPASCSVHPDDVRFADGVVTGIGFHDKQLAWARSRERRVLPAGPAVGGRLLPHRGPALGREPDAGRAVQVLRVRRVAARRWRWTASPARTGCCVPTSCTTSATAFPRSSMSVRSRAASCRAPAG